MQKLLWRSVLVVVAVLVVLFPLLGNMMYGKMKSLETPTDAPGLPSTFTLFFAFVALLALGGWVAEKAMDKQT